MGLLSAAVGVLLFAVPGYVVLVAKSHRVSSGIGAGEKALESVAWSTVVFAVSTALPDRLFSLESFGELMALHAADPSTLFFSWPFILQYGCVLAVAVLVGTAWALVTSRGPLVRLTKRSSFGRVWDEFWTYKRQDVLRNGLWVEMKDGTVWAGRLRAASDAPNERELWLSGVQVVQKTQQGYVPLDTIVSDMLIAANDVTRIFALRPTERSPTARPRVLGRLRGFISQAVSRITGRV